MKYSVGDYLAGQQTVFAKVVAAFEGSQPIYGILYRKIGEKPRVSWDTEYELDKQGYKLKNPDFELWSTIAQGDTIRIGELNDSHMCVVMVLARLGDLVMISEPPTTTEVRDTIEDLSEQIERLTEGAVTKETITEAVKPKTRAEAFKTAHGSWLTIEDLALMNWELLRE